MEEDWKWIKGYEGQYQISNHGRIKSFRKYKDGMIMSNINKNGWYLTVNLFNSENKRKTERIHRLVYETFVGKIPKGYQIHHKDGNKQNNELENLAMLTPREHALETIKQNPHCLDGMIAYNKGRIIDDGRKRYAKSKEPKSRFKYGKILQYSLDGEFINSYTNAADAYRDTGVCQRNILQVANKTPFNNKGSVRKQAGGYIWRFEKEVV